MLHPLIKQSDVNNNFCDRDPDVCSFESITSAGAARESRPDISIIVENFQSLWRALEEEVTFFELIWSLLKQGCLQYQSQIQGVMQITNERNLLAGHFNHCRECSRRKLLSSMLSLSLSAASSSSSPSSSLSAPSSSFSTSPLSTVKHYQSCHYSDPAWR